MFNVNVSELAAVVGLNPYKSQDEAITDCINRNLKGLPPQEIMRAAKICKASAEFSKVHTEMKIGSNQTHTNEDVDARKKEYIQKINDINVRKKADIDETKESIVAEYENRINTAVTTVERMELEIERDSKLQAQNELVKKLNSETEHMLKVGEGNFNRNFGTRKETNAGATYEEVTGLTLKKDNKRIMMEVMPGINLVGKTDGVASDGTLVEIKNRTKRFFNMVPEYENVQVQTYLRMLNIDKAHLVERYDNTIKVHDVPANEPFMDEVLRVLREVCDEYFVPAIRE